jgi:hypothetical protein
MYDLRMNQIEAGYITHNNLDTTAGQKLFGKAWDMPRGIVTSGKHDDVAAAIPGAMELKTTWRVLPNGADDMGYFTAPGSIYVPAANTLNDKDLCLDVELGLVAMHLTQKISTPDTFSDFWVWGTFEHKRNAPVAANAPVSQGNSNSTADNNLDPVASCPVPTGDGNPYAFFNPSCMNGANACGPNDPPAISTTDNTIKWDATAPYGDHYRTADAAGNRYGTQVTRCWDIYDSARNVSSKFQDALGGTVWANYELVGAQWAQAQEQSVGESGPLKPYPAPVYLTNSTLETYLQTKPVLVDGHPAQGASGSCITCHDTAADNAGNKSDFSFLSFYAQ